MDLVLRLDEEQGSRLNEAAEAAGQPVESFAIALIDDALGWPTRRAALLARIVGEDGEVLRRLGEV